MKKNYSTTLALILLLTLHFQVLSTFAQGTAFSYEGQLQDNGAPANGTYDFRFWLYTASVGGTAVAGPVIVSSVPVNDGLFTVTIDFGSSVWNGTINWLEIDVEPTGSSPFVTLGPRQQLMPTPYAIYAATSGGLSGPLPASQLSGTVGNSQLAYNSITIGTGPGSGLSGGGTVPLGTTINLLNSGVISLTAGGGLTVSSSSGAVTLGSTATSGNVANTIASRDAYGSLSLNNLTMAGTLYLPQPFAIYTGAYPFLLANGNNNLFLGVQAGNSTGTGAANIGIGPQALLNNTSGSANIAIGANALQNNSSGGFSIAIGNGALEYNVNGIQDTAVGVDALYANTSGAANTAVGVDALAENTTGHDNTANGAGALSANTVGTLNTATGSGALGSNGGGNDNTANGYNALYNSLTGSADTADGASALFFNTSGGNNTANGFQGLYYNKAGINNTADGASALEDIPTGTNNIAVGFMAGANFTGTESSNIDIGNPGVLGDNSTIRIGSGQTQTYIAGLINGNGGGLTNISATSVSAVPVGMALIPTGSFIMGDSLDGEADAIPTVSTFVSGFYMDTTVITWSQWQTVFVWATNHGYAFDDVGAGSTPNQPVQMVNWYDAVKWCNARSEQAGRVPVYFTDATQTTVYRTGDIDLNNGCVNWTGQAYRLPTEAEWEKAARGGLSGQRFPWGVSITENLANYDGCTTACGLTYDYGPDGYNLYNPYGVGGTTPVDYFAPNGFGLHDMSGNVFEWCWDWYPYNPTPYAGGSNPHGPTGPVYDRIMRGGSWGADSSAYSCRCAARAFYVPHTIKNTIGFRTIFPSGN